eukprot:scaffold45363_cov18-Tisochrysis_lutea.AAC.1
MSQAGPVSTDLFCFVANWVCMPPSALPRVSFWFDSMCASALNRSPCAGGLMSLLFEDLFKRLNTDLKRQADITLSKANRASQ